MNINIQKNLSKIIIYIYTSFYIYEFISQSYKLSFNKCFSNKIKNCKIKNETFWEFAYFSRTLIYVCLISKLVYNDESSLLYILPLLIILHIMDILVWKFQNVFPKSCYLCFGYNLPLWDIIWVSVFILLLLWTIKNNKSKENEKNINQT